jgi:hypothetical protein
LYHESLEVDVPALVHLLVLLHYLRREVRDIMSCNASRPKITPQNLLNLGNQYEITRLVDRINGEVVGAITGVALSGDVEIVALELREPLEPVDEERVRVMSCTNAYQIS